MPLNEQLVQFALERALTRHGEVQFRSARTPGSERPVTHVLLHGIGSGSGSWLMQLEAAVMTEGARVLAWEAPGYGNSSPVSPDVPDAGDYASRLWALLDTLGITSRITLVGHSPAE